MKRSIGTKISIGIIAMLLILIIGFSIISCEISANEPIEYVDPFICTLGDHGQLYPGAVAPFGMVKLSPDTYPSSLTGDGDWAHSGYNYADEHIRGFSHLRKGSSGGTAIFDRMWLLSFFPTIGVPDVISGKYHTAIDKDSERARPGWYQVNLKDYKIAVGLTVDKHSGFHQYTFPRSEDAHIVIDMGSNARISSSSIDIKDQDVLSGYLVSQGKIYFYIRISKPFSSYSLWEKNIYPGQNQITGKKVGAILDFKTDEGEIIYVKVGFSTVSVEQAAKNLKAEIPGWNFEQCINRAQNTWKEVLDNIIVEGDDEYKTIFYTALYHSLLQPSTTTDIDGRYMGYDKHIHMADGYIHYDNYAFWDSYRTKYPLLSLTVPVVMNHIVRSILDIYKQSSDHWFYGDKEHRPHESGFCSTGPEGYRPFLNCRNEHMLTVVLDAYRKGIINNDMKIAYAGMRKEIMVQMPEKYETIGYIPARPDQTCELSYDNWCVAQMAQLSGKNEDYQKFMKRASFYRNTWDDSLRFFRARAASGEWLDFPESPTINREKYCYEGTPWQWRWFVPHDIPGLIDLIGGYDQFNQDLDYFFDNDLYQAGNQPDLHAPFLFNASGAPWLTQKWVRKILTEPMTQLYSTHEFFENPIHDRIYKSTPDGYLLEMDDDYGSMAAWYVLSAMGLFQICPGEPIYQLTAPIFEKVTIKLDATIYPGKAFTIETRNLSKDNIYIQSALLNGKSYNRSWISHQDIVEGGNLIFQMGSEPNKNWGIEQMRLE